jgi:ribonuclease BN (tRNA processing enzyme)
LLRIHILGSGDARAGRRRDTTALAVQADDEWTLVDCPGGAVHKLARLGADLAALRRLIVTHNHVDHVYGFAHLAHALALSAVHRPALSVHAPKETVTTLRAILQAHGLDAARARLDLQGVELQPDVEVAASRSVRIVASPAAHSSDTLALRFEQGGRSVVYASDTGPCESVATLSAGVDLLLHDCAGLHRDLAAFNGQHSSARQAGEIAAAAGVGELRLIHLTESDKHSNADLLSEAGQHFGGAVATAADGDTYMLSPST